MSKTEAKTHYVMLRLLFDTPLPKPEAVQAAIRLLHNQTFTTTAAATDPETKAITRRIVSFKIQRVC